MNCVECIHLRIKDREVWCRKGRLDAGLLQERQEGVATAAAPFVVKRSWLKKNEAKLAVVAAQCPDFEDDPPEFTIPGGVVRTDGVTTTHIDLDEEVDIL